MAFVSVIGKPQTGKTADGWWALVALMAASRVPLQIEILIREGALRFFW